MTDKYDAIVVGGGHNGLVCSALLVESEATQSCEVVKILCAEPRWRLIEIGVEHLRETRHAFVKFAITRRIAIADSSQCE